jgi:choice-of-anchor B domain-containing protein
MLKRILLLSIVAFSVATLNAQLNLSLVGQLGYPPSRGDVSDIWGYVDEFGNEYAIVGNENGTSIVDISDPANPTEVFFSPGAQTIWRDMKVWGDVAYITNEGGNGLKIIDLTNLPGALNAGDVSQFTGSLFPFQTAHNIFIDEVGRAYVLGADNGVGGAIILDLTTDPLNPVELGRYNDYYMHDVYVRGDTLWGGAIYDGFFTVVDVSDPANCVTMAIENTPGIFSHNTWLSDDGNTLYTTDEISDGYVAAYDVSDIQNISELDRVQSSPGQNVIPHNTFVYGNFLVTSYYRDGVVIHDATYPSNLIEVGNYDTAPSMSGDGFNGCWGVYPYLPSGLIIASDIEEGLFILGPTYQQAAYLVGNVTDAVTTNPLNNVLVEIVASSATDNTDAAGDYVTGMANGGTYDVTFTKLGYFPQTITGVTLTNGVTTTLDVELQPQQTFVLQGVVIDEDSNPVVGAQVMISNPLYSTTVTTNGLGEFDVPGFLEDTYDVTIGIWGYHTLCLEDQFLGTAGNPHTYQLETGYSDNFALDLGWTVSGNPDTGDWERGVPDGTTYNGGPSNPGVDSDDCGDMAYITGNGGGQVGSDDIDNGTTILTSPVFDLTTYNNPYLSFERWFFNDGGFGTPNDSLVVELTNGTQTVMLDFADQNDPDEATWAFREYRVEDYISPTAFMQLKVRAMDLPEGHLAEGGFDNFYVRDTSWLSTPELALEKGITVYPNPFDEVFYVSLDQAYDQYETIRLEMIELGSGRVVKNLQTAFESKVELTLNDAKGVYVLKVIGDDNLLKTIRVIKM